MANFQLSIPMTMRFLKSNPRHCFLRGAPGKGLWSVPMPHRPDQTPLQWRSWRGWPAWVHSRSTDNTRRRWWWERPRPRRSLRTPDSWRHRRSCNNSTNSRVLFDKRRFSVASHYADWANSKRYSQDTITYSTLNLSHTLPWRRDACSWWRRSPCWRVTGAWWRRCHRRPSSHRWIGHLHSWIGEIIEIQVRRLYKGN